MSRRSASLAPRAIAAPSSPFGLFADAAFFVLALLAFVASSRADTINVPGDYATIQAAIDAASDSDTVLVQPGTYLEANVRYGGKKIAVASADGPESTVVDGCFSNWVFWFGAGETAEAVLDGFTVTGGNGGGIVVDGDWGASPTIRNCVVSGNRGYTGGGIVVRHGASPLIEDCTIAGNTATDGGGLYVSYDAAPTVRDCRISDNTASGEGGGAKVYYALATFDRCTFLGNEGVFNGGGVCAEGSNVTLATSVFEGNRAGGGAGLFARGGAVALANCIVAENSAWLGGGAWFIEGAIGTIDNCAVAKNAATQGYAGGVYASGTAIADVRNSILWANVPDQLLARYSGSAFADYSLIEGGWEFGEGNIDADPLFRTAHGFDYVLAPGSPCVDAGDPTVQDGISDWHPRWPEWYPNGARSDMGAYGGPNNKKWFSGQ